MSGISCHEGEETAAAMNALDVTEPIVHFRPAVMPVLSDDVDLRIRPEAPYPTRRASCGISQTRGLLSCAAGYQRASSSPDDAACDYAHAGDVW